MSVIGKPSGEEAMFWVPVCCSQVMRYSIFGSGVDKSVAAALRCTSCGRHILLQPQAITSLQDYGSGTRTISLLATPRAHKIAAQMELADGELGEETLA